MAQDAGGPPRSPRIANPIYAEEVPRYLNYAVQETLPQEMAWYVDAAGNLDVEGLIAVFQAFFPEHSGHWVQRFEQYHEAGHLIVFDRSPQRSWEEKIFRREAPPGTGAPVTVWGM